MTDAFAVLVGIVGGLLLSLVLSRFFFWFATTRPGDWWGRLATPKKVRDKW